MTTLMSARPISPGRLIRRELDERRWTQKELAEILGRPEQAIAEIIRGTKQITPETAQELGAAFGTSAELWLNLEMAYRLALARTDLGDRLADIGHRGRLHDVVPLREMIRLHWIEAASRTDDLERQVCAFLEVKSLDAVSMPPVHYRQTESQESAPGAQLAWLRRVESLAHRQRVASSFRRQDLEASLPKIIEFTFTGSLKKIPDALRERGVHFLIVPPLERASIDGAALWVEEHPVVALTLRRDRLADFQRVFMHELAHIVAGHKGVYIDTFELDKDSEETSSLAQEEQEADALAGKLMQPSIAFRHYSKPSTRVRSYLRHWIDVAEPSINISYTEEDTLSTPTSWSPNFAPVWNRIVAHAGQTFHTKTGIAFNFTIQGTSVKPSHTNRLIPQSDFEFAWLRMPLPGPGAIRDQVQGSAYVWAILHDSRIASSSMAGTAPIATPPASGASGSPSIP